MKVLITAGGTSEPIDRVRSITNTSTGKLGSLIAEAYAKLPDITEIYYVCARNSITPQSEKVKTVFVNTVASLEKAVSEIVSQNSIDIIVHSMAVSDYRQKAVTSASRLANSLRAKLTSSDIGYEAISEDFILSLFEDAGTIISNDGKISSNIKDMLLCMEQTPKIISSFRAIAPQALLVGFKLLDHVSQSELIDTAYHLLLANRCSFVLANDLRDISAEQHIGYLIDENKNYIKCITKEEIADEIVRSTMKRSKNR